MHRRTAHRLHLHRGGVGTGAAARHLRGLVPGRAGGIAGHSGACVPVSLWLAPSVYGRMLRARGQVVDRA